MSQVREGYKQTKVGVIPLDWDVVKLNDIATFYKGKGISKNDISTDGIECIRYGELYTKYNEKIEKILSKTNLTKNKLFLSKKNDILIPSSGETAIDLATASCILKDDVGLGGDINIIRSAQSGVYLSYYLNVIAKTKIANLAQGKSVIHLYSSHLKSLKINLPPLIEQEKIAEILTTWDSAISKQEELVKVRQENKKGLMQKLLSGEIRFDGFDGEWKSVKVGDAFDFIKTYSNPRSDLSDIGDIEYLHYGDIHTKYKYHLDLEQNTLPKISIDKFKSNIEYVQDGDLLMADASEDYADIGKSAEVLNIKNKKVVSGLHTHLLRDNNTNFANGYKGLIFYNQYVSKEVKKIATGISVLGISKTNLSKLQIPLPPLPEQEKIAEFLTLSEQKIKLLKIELAELKEQKKALMQKLLTGEVRVTI